MRAATVGIAGLATYGLFTRACGIEKACITGNFSIEHRMFYYVLGVALAIYTAQVALHLVIGLMHWSGEDPNEFED